MGRKFLDWQCLSPKQPENLDDLEKILLKNRKHSQVEKLHYGDHGLLEVVQAVIEAIRCNKRIGLYADYDVDGTMSCVSWIWFLQSIGFYNFVPYIPCRFKEGYGLNLQAIQHLIDEEKVELIITMDTGITANREAAYCKEKGVQFICTDHHKVQKEKMPDCIILNPKMHPDAQYQELCGCGITFVLLRKLGEHFDVPQQTWADLLSLTGMATICDVVPLNGVNHKLARMGVRELMCSQRPVLKKLKQACASFKHMDEKDVGFRLGPRINAVGRLEHAKHVLDAFIGDNPDPLIRFMGECNERRKSIQDQILKQARKQAAELSDDPILFLGGDWHPGVVGIAASKLAEEFWRPVWLFQKKEGLCKGSARSIPGFDVCEAMHAAKDCFLKYGGHLAAGGYSFEEGQEQKIREKMSAYATKVRKSDPKIWKSRISFDCELPPFLMSLDLIYVLDRLKPFGHGFEEPKFCIRAKILGTRFYNDKKTGKPKHTAVSISGKGGFAQKLMFFNEVHEDLREAKEAAFVVSASRNTFRGETTLSLMGYDYEV